MSDLDLIRQLGDRLGRPLEAISEERFEQHIQAKYSRNQTDQELIKRDTYSLTIEGAVSGLFLQPVTSEILFDFPFDQFRDVRHLSLDRVNLSSYSFLRDLKG
ncbi:hypothetical protein ACSYAD_28655, partial [Acaryochloris marina NIES-2412]|uniref:hypothetical protein n=1 Tax=Acaryochloris marina TaxID=155978 RepID=UPI00405A29BB